jgi:hypothetical protein
MTNTPIKNACYVQANEKGIFKVFMPDGTEIPNTQGRTIQQEMPEAKAGICIVKLDIVCNVEPSSEPINHNFKGLKSYSEIFEEYSRLKMMVDRWNYQVEYELLPVSALPQDVNEIKAKLSLISWVLNLQ